MPIGELDSKILRDKKDNYVITIYKNERKKFNITRESILLLEINNCELIRIPNIDFIVSIPKKIINNEREVKIKIKNIYNKNDAKLRDKNLFYGKNLNFKSITPKKTISKKDIYILDELKGIYVWYNIGGGVKHIKIKKEFNAERLAELIGFYFGDGNTTKDIRSFRLNNCEVSILNHCLNILEEIGIKRDNFKIQIIYSTNKDKISEDIKERCISFWSKALNIPKNKIISVNRSKNIRETLEYGSARIFFDNAVLVEIFLHGLLKKFVEIGKNPKTNIEKKIAIGFLRGLLAAEGSVILEKGSLRKIGIAFNPHSDHLEFYKRLLESLGISWKFVHGNELMIHKFDNFKRFFELDAFKLHKKRNEKFISGFKNHKYFKTKFKN